MQPPSCTRDAPASLHFAACLSRRDFPRNPTTPRTVFHQLFLLAHSCILSIPPSRRSSTLLPYTPPPPSLYLPPLRFLTLPSLSFLFPFPFNFSSTLDILRLFGYAVIYYQRRVMKRVIPLTDEFSHLT